MAVYIDSKQLYTNVEALFALIAEKNPGAADAVLASRLVIRLRCTEPNAEITLNSRRRHSSLDYLSPEAGEQPYHTHHGLRLSPCPPD